MSGKREMVRRSSLRESTHIDILDAAGEQRVRKARSEWVNATDLVDMREGERRERWRESRAPGEHTQAPI